MKQTIDAMAKARKLPPPTPGLELPRLSLEEMSAYCELHGLEIVRLYGGQVVVRKARAEAGSMREVAESLARIGEK